MLLKKKPNNNKIGLSVLAENKSSNYQKMKINKTNIHLKKHFMQK